MEISTYIITNILQNKEYLRKVVPHLKTEYFEDKHEQIIFKLIKRYIVKYSKLPTKEQLIIELDVLKNISDSDHKEISSKIFTLFEYEISDNLEWLLDKTEEWMRNRAIYLALMESVSIIDEHKERQGTIPDILKDALSVNLDTKIGHDFFDQLKERFESYQEKSRKIPFRLKMMNNITNGGIEEKTLNVICAGTGAGKTMFMCDWAAYLTSIGKNVLYITLEMSEKAISKRIDANILNINIKELDGLTEEEYLLMYKRILHLHTGKLYVKEYPTAGASVAHFDHLISELAIKKNFIPDVVFVDYINICKSSRMEVGSNSYSYVKSIAEELRGLGVTHDCGVISGTQLNREGMKSSDVEIWNTSESMGLTHTCDLLFALYIDKDLQEEDRVSVKQLKNRYSDVYKHSKFFIGVDRPKMKFYDVDDFNGSGGGMNEDDETVKEFFNPTMDDKKLKYKNSTINFD